MAETKPASGSRGSRFTTCATIVFVAACSVGAYLCVRGNNAPPFTNALSVPASALDFGEVFESRAFSWTFPITNSTDEDVQILAFSSSCNCAAIDPEALTIPPRATSSVVLTLDLTGTASGADDTRDFSAAILAVRGAAYPYEAAWTIKGKIRKVISLSPRSVVFTELIRGTKYPLQDVRVVAHAPLHALEAVSKFADITVRPCPTSKEYSLQLRPKGGLPAGIHHFDVAIDPVADKGRRLGRVTLPVKAVVVESVLSVPSKLIIDTHDQQRPQYQEYLTLSSRLNESFDVVHVGTTLSNVTVERVPDRQNRFCVRVVNTDMGVQHGSVSFSIIDAKAERITLDLPVIIF
jgi:hypothetical protein